MAEKKRLKIYKTPEEKVMFYQRIRNRASLQEKIAELHALQKYIPETNDSIIPIDLMFRFPAS